MRALWTPGHTPGHLCFYDERRELLLSGDHVLPRISPNISLHPQQPDNPLGHYRRSLTGLLGLSVAEVLPGHEYRFSGLAERVAELLAHHEARLAEIVELLRATPDSTTWDLTTRLTWSRPWSQITGYIRRAAVGETLAHLALLAAEGRATRTGQRPARWAIDEGQRTVVSDSR